MVAPFGLEFNLRVYLATLPGIITSLHGQSFEHPMDSETDGEIRSLPVAEHDVPTYAH